MTSLLSKEELSSDRTEKKYCDAADAGSTFYLVSRTIQYINWKSLMANNKS